MNDVVYKSKRCHFRRPCHSGKMSDLRICVRADMAVFDLLPAHLVRAAADEDPAGCHYFNFEA